MPQLNIVAILMGSVVFQLISGTALRLLFGEIMVIGGLSVVSSPLVLVAGVSLGFYGLLSAIAGKKKTMKDNEFY